MPDNRKKNGSRDIRLNLPTRIDNIRLPFSKRVCLIKRDDLIHPAISGNKWRKLMGFLPDDTEIPLITCGGLHSNHLYAFAELASYIPNPCYAIVRGENKHPSFVIDALENSNVTIGFLSYSEYKILRNNEDPYIFFPEFSRGIHIPEGGRGEQGLVGLEELARELNIALKNPAHILSACGTGATVAGLYKYIDKKHMVSGVKMFQDGGIENSVTQLVGEEQGIKFIYNKKYVGRFAERHPGVEKYIQAFYQENNISLDPIYTGRLVYTVDILLKKRKFVTERKVVFYHSGGLSGIEAYINRYPESKIYFKT